MLQAQLLIRRKGQRAEIYFERGNIVHTTLDSQGGEEVLYELLSWDDGSFSPAWLWLPAETDDFEEKRRCRGTQENGKV